MKKEGGGPSQTGFSVTGGVQNFADMSTNNIFFNDTSAYVNNILPISKQRLCIKAYTLCKDAHFSKIFTSMRN